MDEKKVKFGDLLKKLRIEAGFAQQAELSKVVGVTQQTVSRWESGKSVPKAPQIRKLASILKIDEQILLEAAGYAKQSQYNPVTISYDHPFPFESLTPQSFERFCCDLLCKANTTATVHRWGGTGHKQDGIDIKVDCFDGSVHTYQCKRESDFGPQKVKEAIEYQTIAADKKYILLARIASPQARQEVSRHEGWNILDKEDLSRMVRDLSKHEQKCLVDTYFFGQRMALIGGAEPGIWRDSSSHFAPFMNPSNPLNHTLPLIGRLVESQQLYDACIEAYHSNEKAKRIIYLVGVAGIGKSRLLNHVVDKIEAERRDICVWFWDGTSTIMSKDLESLGHGNKLLVVDGCSKAELLFPLFNFVFRNQNITLIVAARYDEFERIKCEASDLGIVSSNTKELNLMPLSESETQQLALQVLKAHEGNEKMARHIAKWTTDSPLATVLTTYIALKENISFAEVQGNKEFKEIIKGKFCKALIGEIGLKMDQVSIHQILRVLALVQPFDILDDRLVECIARLERLESATIKRLLRILVEAGVLWKNQNNDYRLSPEILSDFIIEDICRGVEGKSTGYADTLYKELEKEAPRFISNLIYNLGRFEWTKNMNNTVEKLSILDDIWSKLDDTPEDIEIVDRVSYYQPQKSLNFVEKVIKGRLNEQRFENVDSEVSTNSDLEQVSVSEKYSQENITKAFENEAKRHFTGTIRAKAIFDDLTPIIQTVALHKDFLSRACDLLWQMSKHYDASSQSLNANYNHPFTTLKEIFSYKPYKPLDYLTVAVDWAIELLKTYKAEEHPFSPFDLLAEIMKTFGTIIEGSANSITSTGFTIDVYELVALLRSKIIEAVLKTLASSDTKKAHEAAKFVSDCLTYDENEKNPWTEEALNTLDKLNYVVKNEKIKGYALIALNLQIDQLLLKGEYPITRLLRDIQTQIHKTIQADKELCMIFVMIGGSYEFLWYNDCYKTKIELILKNDRNIQKFLEVYSNNQNDFDGRQILKLFRLNPLLLQHRHFLPHNDFEIFDAFQKDISNKVITPISSDFIKDIFASRSHSFESLYHQINQKYSEITYIDSQINTSTIEKFLKRICETKLDFSEHCVQQALIPQDNDRLWQFAWISLSMLLQYERSKGQEYAAKLLKSPDPRQRELVSQAYGNLSMNEYLLDDVDNESLIQVLNDSDESVISSGLMFIKNIPFLDRNYPKALDLLIRIRKDVSHNILGEMFEIVRDTPLNYHSKVSTLKTKEQVQEIFPKIIFERLCEYLITLQRIPFRYNDGRIEAFLLNLTSVCPEVVLELVLKRAEHAVKNMLFERTFFTSYQIIDMQFLNRETRGVFPLDHSGVKNSKTLLSALSYLPNFENKINQWLVANNDGSNSYENVRKFLRTKILGKSIFDKKADHLMDVKTKHIFEKPRNFIRKTLPNKGDNGWLTHDAVDKSTKEFYDLVEDAYIAADKLNSEERYFADNKWRESSEFKIFQEEIRPLYELFKGYPKTFQQTFDHLIDCFDTKATVIPIKGDHTPLRYAVRLQPSQTTPEEEKNPQRIKFSGNLEQYDGCIEFSDGLPQKVEVTVANKGEEQGKLKADMRQNGYAMSPMNNENNMAYKCLDAIKNKLDKDKHRGKYSECWLMVVLNGWRFESIEDLESFLPFFKEALEKEKYTIDWTQIKSIILYPGN